MTPPPPESDLNSSSKYRNRRDRSLEPIVAQVAALPSRMHDDYEDAVPSRRARELDTADEFETKRRRLDDRVTDTSLARRVSAADTASSTLPERPVSSPYSSAPVQGEQPRTSIPFDTAVCRANHLLLVFCAFFSSA